MHFSLMTQCYVVISFSTELEAFYRHTRNVTSSNCLYSSSQSPTWILELSAGGGLGRANSATALVGLQVLRGFLPDQGGVLAYGQVWEACSCEPPR